MPIMDTQMVNRHRKIKVAMILKGINASDIARELGLTRWSVYQVMAGRSTSKRVRAALAEKLGTTPGRLWPKGS